MEQRRQLPIFSFEFLVFFYFLSSMFVASNVLGISIFAQDIEVVGSALVVDLQEGFTTDTVVVEIDGQVMFYHYDVTTDYALGRADSFTTLGRDNPIYVKVTVPTRDLINTIEFEIRTTPFLGISIIENKIAFRVSEHRFQYF